MTREQRLDQRKRLLEIRRRLGPYVALQPLKDASTESLAEVSRRLGEVIDLLVEITYEEGATK